MSTGESANSMMFRQGAMGSDSSTGAGSAHSSPLGGALTASMDGVPQKSGPFPGLRVASSLLGAMSALNNATNPGSLAVATRIDIGTALGSMQKVPGLFNKR